MQLLRVASEDATLVAMLAKKLVLLFSYSAASNCIVRHTEPISTTGAGVLNRLAPISCWKGNTSRREITPNMRHQACTKLCLVASTLPATFSHVATVNRHHDQALANYMYSLLYLHVSPKPKLHMIKNPCKRRSHSHNLSRGQNHLVLEF